jgi:hypothetical protein
MGTLVEEAVEVLRALPENLQATAARTIIEDPSLYENDRSAA